MTKPLPASALPDGVTARMVEGVNGLNMHVLEASGRPDGGPAVLLLHGFPELAYSWRQLMVPLAEAGYRVIAPDQRGYGGTCVSPVSFSDSLEPFRIVNLVRDMVALSDLLGLNEVSCVVGHDYGASVAAACALVRPDRFRSVAIMSAPFPGAPRWPLGKSPAEDPIHRDLAGLAPPRKHYHAYFATRSANDDMWGDPTAVRRFLRTYFHTKSADWPGNAPYELDRWSAERLAEMPGYYVMPNHLGMAETVAAMMSGQSLDGECSWLTERELDVYTEQYARTGFQGGLNWYRCRMNGNLSEDLSLMSGRSIDVPSLFVAGEKDWGAHQVPGGLTKMTSQAFSSMAPLRFVAGAGHWVQQERPQEVCSILLEFLKDQKGSRSRQ